MLAREIIDWQSRPNEPLPEAVQHVRQGLTYIFLAKGARGVQEKRENYRNAETRFTAAIDSEAKRPACYASAYMNRGLVYALQDKPSLALRDLNRAVSAIQTTLRYGTIWPPFIHWPVIKTFP